jgi:diacylglycerol kinase (ATP)
VRGKLVIKRTPEINPIFVINHFSLTQSICTNANVSDGLLDIVILKNSGSLRMLNELLNMKTGNYSNEGDIIYKQAKKVSINSKERNVAVILYGEPLGILLTTFQVYQSALNFIV